MIAPPVNPPINWARIITPEAVAYAKRGRCDCDKPRAYFYDGRAFCHECGMEADPSSVDTEENKQRIAAHNAIVRREMIRQGLVWNG